MKRILCLLLVCLLCLPGLASAATVVTSFYPIYVFALNLAEGVDGLQVHNLAAPTTGCLHDYQLSASDMRALNRADVFLINGAGMESYLERAMDAFPQLPVVDASVGVPLLPLDEDDDDDHHEHHEHHAHDGHDHGEWNAHIWLSVPNARMMVSNLAAGMMDAFPAQAEAIAANRDAYLARLDALDAELRAGLDGLARYEIVTFHEAFPYFAEAYGLQVAAVINREPDDALTPRSMAALVEQVRALNNPPMFTEPRYSDMAARIIAQETGAPVYQLDPATTGPAENVPLTYYEDCMRRNLAVLMQALGE